MDIQSDKLSLIEWLAGINDSRIIKQFKVLQRCNEQQIDASLTSEEKSAIDQGLKSISEGKIHSHESVKQAIQEKYPDLFK